MVLYGSIQSHMIMPDPITLSITSRLAGPILDRFVTQTSLAKGNIIVTSNECIAEYGMLKEPHFLQTITIAIPAAIIVYFSIKCGKIPNNVKKYNFKNFYRALENVLAGTIVQMFHLILDQFNRY